VTNGANSNEDQVDQRVRDRSGKGSALLHRRAGLHQESRFQQWAVSLADRGLTRRAGRNELQLALNDNPAAKAYQQALFQQGQPAVMFFTDGIKGDYERIKARGAEFTMPPTEVTGSTIAKVNDTCGNLIQITQLARW
jgi:hypothetical protein